jgi:hypothetical protein
MNDETLKRRRPPPTAYDDPHDPIANAIECLAVHVAYLGGGDADNKGAIKTLAMEIREGSNRIAGAIEKLAGAIENQLSKSDAKEEN